MGSLEHLLEDLDEPKYPSGLNTDEMHNERKAKWERLFEKYKKRGEMGGIDQNAITLEEMDQNYPDTDKMQIENPHTKAFRRYMRRHGNLIDELTTVAGEPDSDEEDLCRIEDDIDEDESDDGWGDLVIDDGDDICDDQDNTKNKDFSDSGDGFSSMGVNSDDNFLYSTMEEFSMKIATPPCNTSHATPGTPHRDDSILKEKRFKLFHHPNKTSSPGTPEKRKIATPPCNTSHANPGTPHRDDSILKVKRFKLFHHPNKKSSPETPEKRFKLFHLPNETSLECISRGLLDSYEKHSKDHKGTEKLGKHAFNDIGIDEAVEVASDYEDPLINDLSEDESIQMPICVDPLEEVLSTHSTSSTALWGTDNNDATEAPSDASLPDMSGLSLKGMICTKCGEETDIPAGVELLEDETKMSCDDCILNYDHGCDVDEDCTECRDMALWVQVRRDVVDKIKQKDLLEVSHEKNGKAMKLFVENTESSPIGKIPHLHLEESFQDDEANAHSTPISKPSDRLELLPNKENEFSGFGERILDVSVEFFDKDEYQRNSDDGDELYTSKGYKDDNEKDSGESKMQTSKDSTDAREGYLYDLNRSAESQTSGYATSISPSSHYTIVRK